MGSQEMKSDTHCSYFKGNTVIYSRFHLLLDLMALLVSSLFTFRMERIWNEQGPLLLSIFSLSSVLEWEGICPPEQRVMD